MQYIRYVVHEDETGESFDHDTIEEAYAMVRDWASFADQNSLPYDNISLEAYTADDDPEGDVRIVDEGASLVEKARASA